MAKPWIFDELPKKEDTQYYDLGELTEVDEVDFYKEGFSVLLANAQYFPKLAALSPNTHTWIINTSVARYADAVQVGFAADGEGVVAVRQGSTQTGWEPWVRIDNIELQKQINVLSEFTKVQTQKNIALGDLATEVKNLPAYSILIGAKTTAEINGGNAHYEIFMQGSSARLMLLAQNQTDGSLYQGKYNSSLNSITWQQLATTTKTDIALQNQWVAFNTGSGLKFTTSGGIGLLSGRIKGGITTHGTILCNTEITRTRQQIVKLNYGDNASLSFETNGDVKILGTTWINTDVPLCVPVEL